MLKLFRKLWSAILCNSEIFVPWSLPKNEAQPYLCLRNIIFNFQKKTLTFLSNNVIIIMKMPSNSQLLNKAQAGVFGAGKQCYVWCGSEAKRAERRTFGYTKWENPCWSPAFALNRSRIWLDVAKGKSHLEGKSEIIHRIENNRVFIFWYFYFLSEIGIKCFVFLV